jgi:hypothetical protein
MDEEKPRRRQTQFTRLARTKRILERLRQGWAYDEVAAEEQLTERRVRQIVTEFLKEREAVSDAAHAQIQIDRLGRAMRVAGDALARGDIRAISPLIRVMDRLDRYQTLMETAPRPKTVDQRAADRIVMDSLVARVKRMALEEGPRREAPEGDATASGPPPEPDGNSAAVAPSVVAEIQDAPPAPLLSAPPAPPPPNGALAYFFPYVRP